MQHGQFKNRELALDEKWHVVTDGYTAAARPRTAEKQPVLPGGRRQREQAARPREVQCRGEALTAVSWSSAVLAAQRQTKNRQDTSRAS